MINLRPQTVNTRDSLDHVPVEILSIPENHPLHAFMLRVAHELFLASLDWQWEAPPGESWKMFPGNAWA